MLLEQLRLLEPPQVPVLQQEQRPGQQELPVQVLRQGPSELLLPERQLLREQQVQPQQEPVQPERRRWFQALPTCRPWPDTG